MTKILFVNSVCNGSTGTICQNLYKAANLKGYECCIAYGRGVSPQGFRTYKIGNNSSVYFHAFKARLFDASGFGSKHSTRKFIKWIDKFKPDIIHLHNIHGYYVNIEILFNYLKKHPEIKKIWTLHDCWAFTGHCPHFEYEKCERWKTLCYKCVRKNEYPKSYIDNTSYNYKRKKYLFTEIDNLIIITPSDWLKRKVQCSFLKKYPLYTIHNGVDTNIFKYTESNIKKKYGIENKKIILGVSSVWNLKKGLDSFIKLSSKINDEYKIVLIGLKKDTIKTLSSNILGIERTESKEDLVKWYSAADIFFNPTLEDNYPTVNIESQLCNTPIITNNTGGCKETIILNQSEVIQKESIPIIKTTYKKEEVMDRDKYSSITMCKNYILIYSM